MLEARNRVGGRVWSQRIDPDDPRTVIERGAEFVLAGYLPASRWVPGFSLGAHAR